nr:GNAT family N-acetyltransferase [Nakamurella flavida]
MGRLIAVAATVKRRLVGLVVLRPGTGIVAHTGWIRSLMVDPDEQGRGTGVRLMEAVIALARERGLELVDLSVRDGQGLESFYRRFGFTEWGRRPGWLRPAPGDDRDEIFLILRLADAPESPAAQR